nr:MAG TPA: hypothetical protein [Caudoviricetes sp.]
MAKSKLSYKRSITDKLNIEGVLSNDGILITYEDENGFEQDVAVADLLTAFKNQRIKFSVQLKTDEDLELATSDDEESDDE